MARYDDAIGLSYKKPKATVLPLGINAGAGVYSMPKVGAGISTVGTGASGAVGGLSNTSTGLASLGNTGGGMANTRTSVAGGGVAGGGTYQKPPTQPGNSGNPTGTSNPYSYTPYVSNHFSQLKDSLLAKLRMNTAQDLNRYSGQESLVTQGRNNLINQNQVEKNNALRQLNNTLESVGEYRGGGNVTGTVSINNMAGQNANSVRQDAANQLMQIAAAKDLIAKTAADSETALLSGLGAEEATAMLQAQQAGDMNEMQLAQMLGSFRGTDTLNKVNSDRENVLATAGLLGTLNGQSTLQKQQMDTSNNQWQKSFDNQVGQQGIQNEQWQKSFDNQVGQQGIQNEQWNKEFEARTSQWQKSFDSDETFRKWQMDQKALETEWAKSESNPAVKAQLLANSIASLELANLPELQKQQMIQLKKNIAQIGAKPAMSAYDTQMQFYELERAKKEYENVKNGLKPDGSTINPPAGSQFNLDDYKSRLQGMMDETTTTGYEYNPTTKNMEPKKLPKYTNDQLLEMIYKWQLSDESLSRDNGSGAKALINFFNLQP